LKGRITENERNDLKEDETPEKKTYKDSQKNVEPSGLQKGLFEKAMRTRSRKSRKKKIYPLH